MTRSHSVVALILAGAFAVAACGAKQQPTSQTTVKSETKTTTDTGEQDKTSTKTVTTDEPDGTQTTQTTNTTSHTQPPAIVAPPPTH